MIFDDVVTYTPSVHTDYRGDLYTIWHKDINDKNFVHDKISTSSKNVLRGLHGDNKSWKLCTCLYGEVYLVVVDFRKDSQTYLKWDWIILSDKTKKSILIPPNFLNGHLVLTPKAVFHYKWAYEGEYPDVEDQYSVNWEDPLLNIDWPIKNPILSKRDKNSLFLKNE